MVAATWPHVEVLEDVRLIDAKTVRGWRSQYLHVIHSLLCGVFPCQGLTKANRSRQGMEDRRSQLAWVFLQI